MSSDRSMVCRFDEFWKLIDIGNQSCLEEFLRFVTSQEECRLKWLEVINENRRLNRLLDESKKENIALDLKLTTARKFLDQEKRKKIQAEEERLKAERQLQMVKDVLLADNRNLIHDETKEKLKFLNSTNMSRVSNDGFDHLATINEQMDTTGSMISELSYSRSDDDLDEVIRRRRPYKKPWPSDINREETVPVKRHRVEFNTIDGVPERMVATTTVTMEHDGSMSAQSQIETIPAVANQPPSAPVRCGSEESVESGLSIENNTAYNQGTPRDVGVLPIGSNKYNMRNHSFVSKTVIRPENCDVCNKRIKFGNTVLRCQDCRACCHPICKDNLPLPCIAPGNTPISKKNVGVIADYAPASPPLVPALIQHCIDEIETRGLHEHGLYRVPGSEKEVRALREKFMKCRGKPRLADIDIHVICGCLKDFLRTLREPVVTHANWWQFARAAEINDVEERQARLYQAISQLPQPNRETLAFIILHLLRVAEAKQSNKMSVSNLATVLGPTVIGYSSDYHVNETYDLTSRAKLVLEQLMNLPADYWSRVLSASVTNYSSPLIMEPLRAQRTPSTRSFKRLFETPGH